MRYENLQALVLHVKPYRETSAIVRFFSRDQGVLSVVMRGVRGARKANRLMPFSCGLVSCFGRGTLLTGKGFETQTTYVLSGNPLSAGFYILELITRVVPPQHPEPVVFDMTLRALTQLQQGRDIARTLRPFELGVLEALGYGLDFHQDAHSGQPIDAAATYELIDEAGFVKCASAREGAYGGHILKAISAGDFAHAQTRAAALRICRRALGPLLGDKPLISRQLWEPSQPKDRTPD